MNRPSTRVTRSLLILGGIAAGVGVYTMGALVAVPRVVDRAAERYAERVPGSMASVAAVRTNPLSLSVELIDVAVTDPAGLTFAADRLRVDFSVWTVLERRPVFDAITVEQARLDIESARGREAASDFVRALIDREPRIDRLEISAGGLSIADAAPGVGAEPREWSLAAIDVEAAGLDARVQAAGRYTIRAEDSAGAVLRVDGELRAGFARAEGGFAVSGLDLENLGPWLDGWFGSGPGSTPSSGVAASFASMSPRGRLDMTGAYVLSARSGSPALEFSGARGEFGDLELEPAPGLTVRAPRVELEASGKAAYSEGTLAAETRLDMTDGRFDLVDARVSPQASFALEHVVATVSGASSGKPGVVIDLEARIIDGGTAALVAELEAQRTAPSALELSLRQMPAATLAPYTARSLGAELDAGRVDLTLQYTRRGAELEGLLRVGAEAISFAAAPAGAEPAGAVGATRARGPEGDGGAAPDSAQSQLALVVALLEDSRGAIEVTVPIDARLGGADTVGGAVSAALRARIAALGSAPFEELGRLVERDAASLETVPFEPGTADLSEPALQTVRGLAEALAARPALRLRVPGGFDRRADRDALAVQQIELHVLLDTAGPQARSAPIDFESPRAQAILDEFAGERLAARQRTSIAARFDFDRDGDVEPAWRAVYYRALAEALAANETIADTALMRLGRFRAQSIANALTELGIPAERVEIGRGDVAVEGDRQHIRIPIHVGAASLPR